MTVESVLAAYPELEDAKAALYHDADAWARLDEDSAQVSAVFVEQLLLAAAAAAAASHSLSEPDEGMLHIRYSF